MRIFCVYFTKLESFKRIFLNNILFLSQYKINILVARQINIFLTKHFLFLYLLFCNIQEKIYKPPNSTTRRFPSYLLLTLLLYLLIIFYLPRRTLPDFPSVSSLTSLSFLNIPGSFVASNSIFS